MSVKADSEDKAQKHNARVGRMLTKELDTQRDMERMHLQTIRKEKIRLQKELERVRTKGQYMVQRKPTSRNKRLLQARFNSQSSLESGLNVDAERDLSRSPSVAHKTYTVSTNTGLPRLSAGLDNEAFPMESEYRSRANGYDSYIHRKQLNQQRHRMELVEEQNSLNARIEEFTRSLTPQNSKTTSPPDRLKNDASYEEIITLGDKDSAQSTSSSVSNGSYKQQRKKSRQMTIADYDVNQAKHSVAKRLLSDGKESDDVKSDQSKDGVGIPPIRTNKKLFRRSTQVALLDRDQVNKYSQQGNNEHEVKGHDANTETKNQGTKDNSTRENEVQMNLKGVGANTRRQVLEIIENPEFKFDEEKYAPDGELRTVHMLPDSDEAFEEAKRARYLRWRDPKETSKERELSIGAIFAKDDSGNYVPDIPSEDEDLSNDEVTK